ncbi:uncharacterized protein LOC128240198 [Mya arenaria]|nr:uncharacterized protein LOC128240198 [Mya arenaria]
MFKNTISNPMTEPFSWVRYHNNNPKIPLNIASMIIQSHNGREDQNRQSYAIETHHRVKRGFRSAVADRIAHGFGKRGSILDVGVNRLPQVQRLLNLKSLDAEDDEDDIGLLFHLYRMYKRNIHPALNAESTFNSAHGLENDSFRRLIQRLLSAAKDEQFSELRGGPYA